MRHRANPHPRAQIAHIHRIYIVVFELGRMCLVSSCAMQTLRGDDRVHLSQTHLHFRDDYVYRTEALCKNFMFGHCDMTQENSKSITLFNAGRVYS